MTAFKIDVVDSGVTAALNRLVASARDPSPALKAIGEALLPQVRRTFETSTDPWGRRWQPNSQATLESYLARRSGVYSAYSDVSTRKRKLARTGTKAGYLRKDGRIGAKGSTAMMAKKPLIGEGRFLSATSLFKDVAGNELTIGSSAIYAAIQQFGGKKSEFPHLWGDIPARPFLPIDQAGNLAPDAQQVVIETIQEYLLGVVSDA